jgi:hypothetical protein
MQFVCYIERRDFPLLAAKEGYWKSDLRSDEIRQFLESVGVDYITPFVCFGVLPDGANPNDTLHPLHVFGDTPVMLRPEIANEVELACFSDLQNTAVNGLKARTTSGVVSVTHKDLILDLRLASIAEKAAHLRQLCSRFDSRTYSEVRIYRTITWNDVDANCRNRLQKQAESPADALLGPDLA